MYDFYFTVNKQLHKMEMEIPVIVTDETEKSTSNVACGMPKCQAIRLCVCKLSDRHNQQLDQHISTPEGNELTMIFDYHGFCRFKKWLKFKKYSQKFEFCGYVTLNKDQDQYLCGAHYV